MLKLVPPKAEGCKMNKRPPTRTTCLLTTGLILLLAVNSCTTSVDGTLAGNGVLPPPASPTSTPNGELVTTASTHAPTSTFLPATSPSPTVVSATPSGISYSLAFAAAVDGRGVIHVMELDSREPLPVTSMMYDARSPQWSPEGTRLAFIAAFNANDPDLLCMAILPDYRTDCLDLPGVLSFAWAPGGEQLAIATDALVEGSSYNTYLYDTKDRKPSVILEADVPTVQMAWSPNGQWISAIATSVRTAVRFAYLFSTSGQMQRLQTRGMPETVDWHPNGQLLAYDNVDYPAFDQLDIRVINVDGTDDYALTNTGQFSHEPQWSPSGTSLAYQSYGLEELPALFITDVEAGKTTQISPLGARSSSPAWSPDGRVIAFLVETDDVEVSGYSLYLYFVGTGAVQELLGGGLLPRRPAWRP